MKQWAVFFATVLLLYTGRLPAQQRSVPDTSITFTIAEMLEMGLTDIDKLREKGVRRAFKVTDYTKDEYYRILELSKIVPPEEAEGEPVKRKLQSSLFIPNNTSQEIEYQTTSLTEFESMERWALEHGYKVTDDEGAIKTYSKGKINFVLGHGRKGRSDGEFVNVYYLLLPPVSLSKN
jgi:hypothetical protein